MHAIYEMKGYKSEGAHHIDSEKWYGQWRQSNGERFVIGKAQRPFALLFDWMARCNLPAFSQMDMFSGTLVVKKRHVFHVASLVCKMSPQPCTHSNWRQRAVPIHIRCIISSRCKVDLLPAKQLLSFLPLPWPPPHTQPPLGEV